MRPAPRFACEGLYLARDNLRNSDPGFASRATPIRSVNPDREVVHDNIA